MQEQRIRRQTSCHTVPSYKETARVAQARPLNAKDLSKEIKLLHRRLPREGNSQGLRTIHFGVNLEAKSVDVTI